MNHELGVALGSMVMQLKFLRVSPFWSLKMALLRCWTCIGTAFTVSARAPSESVEPLLDV